MTKTALTVVALVGLVQGLAGCDSRPSPTAPSTMSGPPAQISFATVTPAPPVRSSNGFITFKDPYSGFTTSDLHDARERIVRISVGGELIWIADGTRLAGYFPWGNSIPAHAACACDLIVRFGTRGTERRAYLTADYGHDNPGTMVNLGVSADALIVARTDMFIPGTYTLSGVVTDATQDGPRPVERAVVWRLNEEQTGWQTATTDASGFYELHGLYDGNRDVAVIKDGYETARSVVFVSGNTRFDRQIVRR